MPHINPKHLFLQPCQRVYTAESVPHSLLIISSSQHVSLVIGFPTGLSVWTSARLLVRNIGSCAKKMLHFIMSSWPTCRTRRTLPSRSMCEWEWLKPKKGDALIFYSLNPDGEKDLRSLHAACPVIKGDKWFAIKWLRMNSLAG